MENKTICYDSQSCIRCYSCMVNCAQENRVRLQRDQNIKIEKSVNMPLAHLSYLTPSSFEIGKYPDARKITAFKHCMHCENPQCMNICPANAISRHEASGAVIIDEKTCVGCRACYDACPYDVPLYDAKTNKSYKCIKCYDRLENGLVSACVEACPTGAMFMGDRKEVLAEAKTRAKTYSDATKLKFVVYGGEAVNSHVGRLGWVTISPERDLDDYGVADNPFKLPIVMRSISKYTGAGIIAAAFMGIAAHGIFSVIKKREENQKEDSHEK